MATTAHNHSRKRISGWWEEYRCGCVSETVRSEKDLFGYCPQHGEDRRHVYPELKTTATKGER